MRGGWGGWDVSFDMTYSFLFRRCITAQMRGVLGNK